jgi:hypothetical protein
MSRADDELEAYWPPPAKRATIFRVPTPVRRHQLCAPAAQGGGVEHAAVAGVDKRQRTAGVEPLDALTTAVNVSGAS